MPYMQVTLGITTLLSMTVFLMVTCRKILYILIKCWLMLFIRPRCTRFFGFLDFYIFWGISGHVSGTKRSTGDLLVTKWPDFRGLCSYMRGSHSLSARRAQRTKSRGLNGLQLEVWAQRAPTLLVFNILVISIFSLLSECSTGDWWEYAANLGEAATDRCQQ